MKSWKSKPLGLLFGIALLAVSCDDRPVESPPADPPDEVSNVHPTDSINPIERSKV